LNQEVFDITEQVTLNGKALRVASSAAKGSGICLGRASFLISDGINSTTVYEDLSLAWTVN